MKKLISIFSIGITAILLSSCIIVGPDTDSDFVIEKKKTVNVKEGEDTSTPSSTPTTTTPTATVPVTAKHAITCYNDTSYIITDWCVKQNNILTYANSTNNRMIASGGKDTIPDLLEGRYQIFFSFDTCGQLQPCNYSGSEEFYLNTDITYILSERTISIPACRSAEAVEPVFVLKGSDGSEIELIKQ